MIISWLGLLLPCSWGQVVPAPAPEAPEAPRLVPPVLLEAPPLASPEDAPAGGTVEVLLLIDEEGRVEEATLLAGEEPLAGAALDAARALRFTPAQEGDRPVAVEVPWAFSFPPSLEAPQADAPAGGASEQDPPPPQEEEGLIGTFYRPSGAPVLRSVTAEQVATTPGTLGDPVRAVANLPGLTRTPLDAGWLIVRGGAPEDTGLFIDGVRVPLVYHLGGLTSAIHPAFVSEVQFMPSAPPVRYGRATAGVLELRTRSAAGPARATVGVDLVSSGLFASAPFARRKGGVAVSLRRSYLDGVLDLVPGITEEQSRIAPRFWDWGARVDLGRSGLFAFGYDDAIDAPANEDGGTVTITLGTTRVHGRSAVRLGDGELTITPYAAREWATIDSEEITDVRRTLRAGGRLERPDPGEGPVGWTAGLDGELGEWELTVNDVGVGGRFGSADPYASLRVGRVGQIVAGLRAETLFLPDQLPRVAPSARLGLRVPLAPDWTAVADMGTYNAWPPFDMALGMPGGAYLPLSRSWGGGAGLRTTLGPIAAELDLWGRAMADIAVSEDDNSLGLGRGVAWGAECLLTSALGPVSGHLSGTWSRSFRQDEPGHAWEPYAFDQPLVTSTVLAWQLSDAWTLATRFRYASGYPRDPDVDDAYDLLRDELRPLDEWPERTPPFHALDLKLSRRLATRRWAVEGYLDIQNVYNRRVPEPAITGVRYQAVFYSYGLPILPIFGVQGRFQSD